MVTHIRPSTDRFTCRDWQARATRLTDSVFGPALSRPCHPSTQSPFARMRRYLMHQCIGTVSGHYPTFFAHMDSCDEPKGSLRLQVFPYSKGLCRLSSRPAASWPLPTLSPQVFPMVPGPLPRWSLWCTRSFLPITRRPSPCCNRVGLTTNTHTATSVWTRISRLFE